MKVFKLIAAILIIKMPLRGQTIEYKYDANGNRYQRKLVVGSPSPTSSRFAATDTSDQKKNQEKGIQMAMKYGATVYPNTTSDVIHVAITKPVGNEIADAAALEDQNTIYLLDNNGRVLQKQQQSTLQTSFDLSQYKAGIYYIRILFKDESLFYKVVKLE